MEKEINLQHVQLPNNMTKDEEVKPKDLLIYVCIKKFMNKNTKEAFPSLKTLSELSGISVPTIRKSIDILKKYNYISIRKEGRKNVYRFNSYKNFEPFSYDFLEKKELDSSEKAIIVASQQKMFKDVKGYGKITMSDSELADYLNISNKTLSRVNKSLVDKGYLSLIKTNTKDSITGLYINEKLYHLNDLEQAIVFTLQNHENRLEKTEENIDILNEKMKSMSIQLGLVIQENKELKKEKEKQKNPEIQL
jgi:DNA-binding GntR family transcriptional regulator